jgi:ATP-dependent Zn protease
LDGYLNECHVLAHQIIVKYKDVHTALVDALMKKGSLTYNECKRVWNERD